jgi:hypothetical protein
VATPLAALLPLVDPGDAKSVNCHALLEHAQKEVPASPPPAREPPASPAATKPN